LGELLSKLLGESVLAGVYQKQRGFAPFVIEKSS
jgi:hypothetical protein